MRGCVILCALGISLPTFAPAQVNPPKSRQDSVARADSIARADSLALLQLLEKELGQPAADSSGNAAAQVPRATGGYMNIGFVALIDAGWSTEADVPSLQRGDHDPRVRGFTIPNTELTLDGAVDPYFKGFASIVALKINQQQTRRVVQQAGMIRRRQPLLDQAQTAAWSFRITPVLIIGPSSKTSLSVWNAKESHVSNVRN